MNAGSSNHPKLFDFPARPNVKWVRAESASDWRYGGHSGFAGDNAIEVRTNAGETLDLDYEDEEIPEGRELDDTLRRLSGFRCLDDGKLYLSIYANNVY